MVLNHDQLDVRTFYENFENINYENHLDIIKYYLQLIKNTATQIHLFPNNISAVELCDFL